MELLSTQSSGLCRLGTHCLHLCYIRSRFVRGKAFLFNARRQHNRFRQDKMTSVCNNLLPSFFSLMNFPLYLRDKRTLCTVDGLPGSWCRLSGIEKFSACCYCQLSSPTGARVIIAIGVFGVFLFHRSPCSSSSFYPLGSKVTGTVAALKLQSGKKKKKMRVGQVEQIITSAVSSGPCVDRD